MKPENRQILLAELYARKNEIEAELAKIESLIAFVEPQNPLPQTNTNIYSDARNLADLAKACLKSVNGAWLKPTDIADMLLQAGVVKSPRGLAGHISTALRRRMNAQVNRDTEIEPDKRRGFRYVPAASKAA